MSIQTGASITSQLTSRDATAADQGNAYVAITPTPGTGIIGFATSTTLAIGELNPDFFIYNPGPNTVYPLYARTHCTVVSTGSTDLKFTMFTDIGQRGNVTGTALTIANCNPASANTSKAVITVGVNALGAATPARKFLSHVFFHSTIDVVHDIYNFSWGSNEPVLSLPIVATVNIYAVALQAVAIPPGYCFGITHWNASQSAAQTLEWEFGYIER